jgi:hypothetical protein
MFAFTKSFQPLKGAVQPEPPKEEPPLQEADPPNPSEAAPQEEPPKGDPPAEETDLSEFAPSFPAGAL